MKKEKVMETTALNTIDPGKLPEKVKVDLCVLALQMIMEGKSIEVEG